MKCAIILAGGKGTRMKTDAPKVMCEVIFEPMIKYVVDAVKDAGADDICVITGYKHEIVEGYLSSYENQNCPAGATARNRSRSYAGKGFHFCPQGR